MKALDTKTAIALRPLLEGLINDYNNLWETGAPMGQVLIDGDFVLIALALICFTLIAIFG